MLKNYSVNIILRYETKYNYWTISCPKYVQLYK